MSCSKYIIINMSALYSNYVIFTHLFTFNDYTVYRFMQNFLNDKEEAESVLCSPMERESFKGLPPALFVISECDPLADQAPGMII